jgi:hypothetical protein
MYTVEYYPPGREDTYVFSCREKPTYAQSEDPSMHTLMVSFKPTNGAFSKGRVCTVPASTCIVIAPREGTDGEA